jgi:hypothetical protein
MRNLLYKFKIVLLAVLIMTSCNDDFLETKPLDQFAAEDIWGDPALTEAFINKIYRDIPVGLMSTAGSVDESRSRSQAGFEINNSLITPDNSGYGSWNSAYASIRTCNIFLEKAEEINFGESLIDGKTQKDRMVGEVVFLRAWNYFNLTSYLGGVPIITKVYGLNDEFSVPRNSYAECMKFIVDECDKAAGLLPEVHSGVNDGRATKGAALALKSRALLYAASDLHNPEKNTIATAGFSNPELLGYTSGDAAARWKAAKDAAKEVMDLGLYNLYKADPAPGDSTAKNYAELFLSNKSEEDILVRYFAASISKGINGWGWAPNGWYGNGGVGAINELVEDYEMADGSRFDRNNPAHALEPYKNRDPRFYASILHEGAVYRPRPVDLRAIDPLGAAQFGTWHKWEDNELVKVYGLDSRNSIANSWNANNCRATMRKFLDPAIDIEAGHQDLTWRYFRYAEILLNYAEACIELGEDAEARTYINMIRKRAGMPDVTESGDALRQRYRNERRIEMVYEDQRFFDVRRWLAGPDAYHAVHGVDIIYELNPDKTTATIPTITPVQLMTGAWLDKLYFFPISRGEMNKNDLLIQNPGYN